jgi:hypothetical protein
MSNWGIEDNDSDQATNSESNGPKALREAYAAQKLQNEELRAGMAAIQGELKQQKVQSTLSQLGVSPEAATHYKGDADPEQIATWATSMRSIFGAGETSHAPSSTTTTPVPAMDSDTAAQLQRMNAAGQTGAPLGNAEAAMGRVGDADSMQGLIDAWKTMH